MRQASATLKGTHDTNSLVPTIRNESRWGGGSRENLIKIWADCQNATILTIKTYIIKTMGTFMCKSPIAVDPLLSQLFFIVIYPWLSAINPPPSYVTHVKIEWATRRNTQLKQVKDREVWRMCLLCLLWKGTALLRTTIKNISIISPQSSCP